jgi:hypothetical protein
VAHANRRGQQAQQASGTLPKVITNQDLPADPRGIPQSSPSGPLTEVSGVDRPNGYVHQQRTNRQSAEQCASGSGEREFGTRKTAWPIFSLASIA